LTKPIIFGLKECRFVQADLIEQRDCIRASVAGQLIECVHGHYFSFGIAAKVAGKSIVPAVRWQNRESLRRLASAGRTPNEVTDEETRDQQQHRGK